MNIVEITGFRGQFVRFLAGCWLQESQVPGKQD